MTYEEILIDVKKRIKEKFGTIKHFAYSADIHYAELNKYFAQRMRPKLAEEFKKKIDELIVQTDVKHINNRILAEEREYIRAKILTNYKNVERFLVDNPEFTKSFISNVINGRKIRNDKRYRRLLATVQLLKYAPESL
jgi:hypothetical protein